MENKEELGEWVGLCKIDKDGKPRKVVKCSCVVVKVSFYDNIINITITCCRKLLLRVMLGAQYRSTSSPKGLPFEISV